MKIVMILAAVFAMSSFAFANDPAPAGHAGTTKKMHKKETKMNKDGSSKTTEEHKTEEHKDAPSH